MCTIFMSAFPSPPLPCLNQSSCTAVTSVAQLTASLRGYTANTHLLVHVQKHFASAAVNQQGLALLLQMVCSI